MGHDTRHPICVSKCVVKIVSYVAGTTEERVPDFRQLLISVCTMTCEDYLLDEAKQPVTQRKQNMEPEKIPLNEITIDPLAQELVRSATTALKIFRD